MRKKLKKILKESLLKTDYRKRMIYGRSLFNESKDEWNLYDSLVNELRRLSDDKHIDEIRYRVSDNEVPIKVVTEVLNKIKKKNKELRIIEIKILNQLNLTINEQIQHGHPH
jgi:hypothetical protein